MPKRKIKEAVPRKKMSIKELIIPSGSYSYCGLYGFVITHFFPPPDVLSVCLKAHNLDPYNVYPRVYVVCG